MSYMTCRWKRWSKSIDERLSINRFKSKLRLKGKQDSKKYSDYNWSCRYVKRIQLRILNNSHHSIDHSGFIHHKIARRTFALVFALAAENVLYLYDGPNSETTLDVICLHSYRTKPGANTGSRFKFKLEQRVRIVSFDHWLNPIFFKGLRDSSFLCGQYLWYDSMDGHFRTIISTVS